MNQADEVLSMLRDHPVRPLEAWVKLGCYRLADSIYKLRNRGHVIETRMIQYTRSDGLVKEFAEYTLLREKKK
jgi:radical SAM superfamily enzyme